jgi:DNA-binding CsgD family transcriptional regulator
MTAWEALKSLTAELMSAATADDMGRALLAVAKRFGLSKVLIIDARHLGDCLGPSIVFSSSDRDIVSFASDAGLATSPTYLRARTSDRPFFVSHADSDEGYVDASPWEDGAVAQRCCEGFVVPIYAAGELEWCVVFSGYNLRLSHPVPMMLSAAAHAALGRYVEHSTNAPDGILLSAREYECLRWIADGKTDAEVGAILNISARTVRFHMRNAKDKLGVATRVQAVAMRASGSVSCGRRMKVS